MFISIITVIIIAIVTLYIVFKLNQALQRKFDVYLLTFNKVFQREYTYSQANWLKHVEIAILCIGFVFSIFIYSLNEGFLIFSILITLILSVIILFRPRKWRLHKLIIKDNQLVSIKNNKVVDSVLLNQIVDVKLSFLHLVIKLKNKKTITLPLKYSNPAQLYAVLKTL